MKNGWTAGQHSIFRAIFGSYLFIHFAKLVPWGSEVFSRAGVLPDCPRNTFLESFNILAQWDTPGFVVCFIALGAGLSLLLAAGLWDRGAAIGAWYIWACLLGRNPLISNPSIPFVGWMLLAHACLPRPQFTKDGPWRMAPELFAAAWIVMALGYSYSGLTKLMSPSWQNGSAILKMVGNPLGRPGLVQALLTALPPATFKLMTWGALSVELLFAPLCLIRAMRPWIWGTLLGMHLLLIAAVDFVDLSAGMVMLHLFTFDPAWIRPRAARAPGTIFYDGTCGFCHGFVRFVLSEEPAGRGFRFRPLASGETLVVETAEGETQIRSEAVLYVLGRLGGVWRLVAAVGRIVPRVLRDQAYDAFARVRHRLFRAPDVACPVLPANFRTRFSE